MSRPRLAFALSLFALASSGFSALAVHTTDPAKPEPQQLSGLRWSTELPAPARIAHTSEQRFYVLTTDGAVLALDLQNGAILWQRAAPKDTSLLLVRDSHVLAVGSRELRCWDGASGRLEWVRGWSYDDEPDDTFAVDTVGQSWLVRSVERRRFTEMISSDGKVLWNVGPAAGGTWIGHGLLFTLGKDGALAGHSLSDGKVMWTESLEPGAYRLEPDGVLSLAATGRRWRQIAAGPRLEPVPPVTGATPESVRSGPVQCEPEGCRVQTSTGWRWFEGYVQLLPEELRVFQAAGQAKSCIGCMGQPQPELLRVESWDRDGTSPRRKAYVRSLGAREDERGFVELAGRWVLATGWMAP